MSNTAQNNKSRKIPRPLNEKILLGVLAAIVLTIALGTAAVFLPTRSAKNTPKGISTAAQPDIPGAAERIWTGIGTVRAPIGETKGGDPKAIAVISMGFPYDPADKTFQEELALNVGRFREETQKYFSGIDTNKVQLPGEETIKQDLLMRFNAHLRLGRIKSLYFSEFIILD
ncbi:hypothetical protein AGMMS50212_09930 [Spirochaetia bacterium]|nr:hypothetical protein AGMMS50212_09930 [Spirochaetia bacterium]